MDGLSKPSLLRSYKRTYINYTRTYKSVSEVKSRSVVRDEGEGGKEVNVNRFLIKLGRTGDGPLFIVTNARTVRIGGLNDRSMFVRYVFELLARINTNIKRKLHGHKPITTAAKNEKSQGRGKATIKQGNTETKGEG